MAGTAISITNFSELLKETYPDDTLNQMVQDGSDDPFWMAITKDTEWGGTQAKVPVVTSTNVRVGASFSGAQGRNSNKKNSAFTLTGVEVYSIASYATKTLRQSRGNQNAFMSVVTQEMDMAVAGLNMKICTQLYRNGTGSVAQVASDATVASTSLKLKNPEDIYLFEVGDTIAASATDGGALESGTVVVTGINQATQSLVAAGNWSTSIGTLAQSDFLYRAGGDDACNGGTHVVIEGFESWCPPSSAALTVSFFGVVRSTYQSKLAGLFYDNTLSTTSDPMAEAFVNFASQIQANGARKANKSLLDLVVVNPKEYRKITNAHSSKLMVLPSDGQQDAKIGASKFGLITDYGVIPIKQSIFAVAGHAYFISTSTWTLYTAGPIGLIDDGDGLTATRGATADEWEVRLGAIDMQLGCNAPGWNGIMLC
jgi:hypothetical protein